MQPSSFNPSQIPPGLPQLRTDNPDATRPRAILPSPYTKLPRVIVPPRVPVPLRARSNPVEKACEPCRQKKIKCSGDRPRCNSCIRRKTECTYRTISIEQDSKALKRKYDEIQDKNHIYEQLFDLLRSVRESDAHEILRRIRGGADIETTLRLAKDGDLFTQLTLVPDTRIRYDFPYTRSMPSNILLPNNPYLNSVIYETVFKTDGRFPQSLAQVECWANQRQSIYLTPYHAAEIIDPRLPGLQISSWTSVISDDVVFRRLLHGYFLHDYLNYPSFHKDIFLQAIRDGDERFCSRLLVNAVLSEACHSYRGDPFHAHFWKPETLEYRFLAEAKRLWELEYAKVNLTTLQSAMVLHIIYSFNGMDQIGLSYLMRAVTIAQKMSLFDVETHRGTMKTARTFTAWCLYRWQALYGLHFFRAPLMRDPPATPMPDPDEDPSWYGEFWLRYPCNSALFAAYHAYVFRGITQLRMIANEMSCIIFEGTKVKRSLDAAEIEMFHSKLEAWHQGLPPQIGAKRAVLPGHLKMHMEYCMLLYKVAQMQPAPTIDTTLSGSSTSTNQADSRTVDYALAGMETLARLYYVRHSFEFTDTYMTYFLSVLANVAMERMAANPDNVEFLTSLSSTLILCVKGLFEQGQHVYVANIIGRLLRARMTPDDLSRLRSQTAWNGDEGVQPLAPQYTRSDFPVTTLKLDEDAQMATLEKLVEKYEEMALEADASYSSRNTTPDRA